MLTIKDFRQLCIMASVGNNGFISVYNGEIERFKMSVGVFNGFRNMLGMPSILNKYPNVTITFFYDETFDKTVFTYIQAK